MLNDAGFLLRVLVLLRRVVSRPASPTQKKKINYEWSHGSNMHNL